ncbi:MAG: zinc ribbon domain-containing protein [Gemmatimonadaceae bacterium]|nr:zinc ribbon domain-containing protein [Gemmatimonadaceae bacterium]NUQ93013.1 zinc ribbon domain-containing protein [Gemmatimonadaceae bacterium]NUR18889.1 zinc ribbon domain-containing protein [Gemmatimonadaceae bacterium]
MIALVVGTILAIAAMAFVLAPLFRDANATLAVARPADARGELRSRGEAAVEALREIEFDRATGKLADGDYETLKARYTKQAVAALRAESKGVVVDESDVEAAIRRAREAQQTAAACPQHGPRPERDAIYCSECGRFLPGGCAHCGATPSAPGARFCESCGHKLLAA